MHRGKIVVRLGAGIDDDRSGNYEIDVTQEEAQALADKGRKVTRRGRKPKAG